MFFFPSRVFCFFLFFLFFVATEKEILNVLFTIIFSKKEKCDKFFSIWNVYYRKEAERERGARERKAAGGSGETR